MKRKYYQAYDGDEYRYYTSKRNIIVCCDCALAHDVEFRIAKGRLIYARTWRNKRVTALFRRHRKIKIVDK